MTVIAGVPVLFRRVASGEYDVIADAESIGLGLHCLGTISRDVYGWRIWGTKYPYRYATRNRATAILLADWSLRERVQAVTHE